MLPLDIFVITGPNFSLLGLDYERHFAMHTFIISALQADYFSQQAKTRMSMQTESPRVWWRLLDKVAGIPVFSAVSRCQFASMATV